MVRVGGEAQGGMRWPSIQVDEALVISRTGSSALWSCIWRYGVLSRVCFLVDFLAIYPRVMVDRGAVHYLHAVKLP
jgi:hypothetical protein